MKLCVTTNYIAEICKVHANIHRENIVIYLLHTILEQCYLKCAIGTNCLYTKLNIVLSRAKPTYRPLRIRFRFELGFRTVRGFLFRD